MKYKGNFRDWIHVYANKDTMTDEDFVAIRVDEPGIMDDIFYKDGVWGGVGFSVDKRTGHISAFPSDEDSLVRRAGHYLKGLNFKGESK